MKRKKFLATLVLLAVISVSFWLGSWYGRRENPQGGSSSARTAGAGSDERLDPGTDTSSLPPGTVRLSSERQQTIGLRIGRVEKATRTHILRALGRVAVDETRIYRINAAVDGWIRKTSNNSTGSLVKKDELLASFYSPDFLGAQQAYIFALGSLDRFQGNPREKPEQITLTRANVQQYKDALRNLGMGDLQIEEIGRTRLYTEYINITAPVTGFVLVRNVSPGERFDKGKELFRIADLSRVWILADTFENEVQYLQPGKTVKVSLPHQKKTLLAKVSGTLPQFDGSTRTLKVRLEADNPDFFLRPDMFVDLEFPIQLPPAIIIPADALLDSGLKKTVFIDRGNGFFEPREVETGWHLGNRVEIVKGLNPGERIALSGTFLIDSESKLEMAAAGMQETLDKDPVCGLSVSRRKAEKEGRISTYLGKTYYFNSEECKQHFEKDPKRYAEKHAEKDSSAPQIPPSKVPKKSQRHDHS